MFRRARHHRFAFWAVAFALLLKAAMPYLAVASADAQGLTLVEVCTVYGVSTVVLDADGAPVPHDGHDTSAHAGEACALSALAGFVDAPRPMATVAALRPPAQAPPALRRTDPHHADAAWVARLKHGPPSLS